jgi:hypothetical protein
MTAQNHLITKIQVHVLRAPGLITIFSIPLWEEIRFLLEPCKFAAFYAVNPHSVYQNVWSLSARMTDVLKRSHYPERAG